MIKCEATQWSVYLPPQELSQKCVKRREDKVHEEKAIKFLSHEALPALQTVDLISISKIGQTPARVQRKTATEVFRRSKLGLALGP